MLELDMPDLLSFVTPEKEKKTDGTWRWIWKDAQDLTSAFLADLLEEVTKKRGEHRNEGKCKSLELFAVQKP